MHFLSDQLAFPSPESATEEGVVAVGGDVSPERLLLGYSQGIFPWPVEGLPLLWFSPDPRFVLSPSRLIVSRSLRKAMRRGSFVVRMDTAFSDVIRACAEVPRPGQRGTWITPQMVTGYEALHRLGYAHSVEAYCCDELVGGLYGVSLGRAFFGESMFSRVSDASKVAFVTLVEQLRRWEFSFVDCQVYTRHLERFGAESWPRRRFLAALGESVAHPTRTGQWAFEDAPDQ